MLLPYLTGVSTLTKKLYCVMLVKREVYPEYTNFSPSEIKSFLGLYLLNALNPSPQINMKFKSQAEDTINGNDLCHERFGKME